MTSNTHKLFGGSTDQSKKQKIDPPNGGYTEVVPQGIQKPYLRGAKLVVPLKPPRMYMRKPKV